MPQYEFIEVRFFARTSISKVAKQVKRFLLFDGIDYVWPPIITWNFVASTQGSLNKTETIAQATSQFIDYTFLGIYGNEIKGKLSINDLIGGQLGSHEY